MIAVEFVAGLGDFIRQSHRTNSYTILSEVSEPVDIIIGSHNPFVTECFTFHPNRSFFNIHLLPHKYVEFFQQKRGGHGIIKGLYEFAGVDFANRVHSQAKEGMAPVYFAPDEVEETNYVVVQPFAGGQQRNVPPAIVREMIGILLEKGFKVIVISRSYIVMGRGGLIHGPERADYGLSHENLHYINDLSVPASLNLVKKSKLFVGAHSSLLQMAWYANIPVCVLYPKGHPEWREEVLGKDYTWGALRSDCLHENFRDYDPLAVRDWIERVSED